MMSNAPGKVALCTVAALLWSLPVVGQNLTEGKWTYWALTPGGELAEATYEVKRVEGSLRATMVWDSGRTEIENLHLQGTRMSFSWDPGFHMDCRAERGAKDQYRGACKDGLGKLAPLIISPPGSEPDMRDFDLDKAFELWGFDRETYMREHAPQPKKTLSDTGWREPVLPAGRMVEVGGRRLNVVESGTGDVTVVLESGTGDDHKIWQRVQEAASKRTRVVSYDRAGLGLSDKSLAPPTPESAASDLHALLAAAGIPPPYVLVGHEGGAFTVRRFAAEHPDDVAGLVLVDPALEGEGAIWKDLDSESWQAHLRKKSSFLAMTSPAAAAEFEETVDLISNGTFEAALPDVPVVVVSATRPFESPHWVGETEAGIEARRALHESFARTAAASHLAASRSSSYVQLDEPELLVDAIEQVLRGVEK